MKHSAVPTGISQVTQSRYFHDCLSQLRSVVGSGNVLMDQTTITLASYDLIDWPKQQLALAVVRPRSTQEVVELTQIARQYNLPLIARGAGLSYSGGGVPHTAALVVDMENFCSIDIHPEDLFATVGAGTTWQAVAQALAPHGLKPAQPMPISGIYTTVGGAASQGMPGGLDGIIGLTVVLSDGVVVRTGSGAHARATAFQRYWGPDLTGLFLGDCGIFGIKTEIHLRLTPVRPTRFASFSCSDGSSSTGLMTQLLQGGLPARVVINGPGNGNSSDKWMLHVTVEGATEDAAESVLTDVRLACRAVATEVDAEVPRRLHARPFSIRGFVGLDGERWLPVHGVLPLTQAAPCLTALTRLLESRNLELQEKGIQYTWTLSSMGPYVTIEPMFYWSDALTPLHLHYLSARHRERFSGRTDASDVRDHVRQVRGDVRRVMDEYGAVHAQLGRYFAYQSALAEGTNEIIGRIKRSLDSRGIMNPGVLEA